MAKYSIRNQIDLIYDRKDKVYTICEIKYQQSKVRPQVIEDFEKKLNLFPNSPKKTIHKVLITANGAEESLINMGYFDRIISFKDIFY
ncbi:phage related ATPase [Candidatus Magnetomorum sp. HK-1]|nr:phage related ATPase [Candidatus Magnetomorum sp. HK-1]